MISARMVRIEWADCDPKGIVYYPRYFSWFDSCTTELFERALGMPQTQMLQSYQIAGVLLVNARGRFLLSATFGDELVVTTEVTAWRRSSFEVHHRMLKHGALAVEGFETRVWVARDRRGRLKSVAIPQSVRARLSET